MSTRVEEQVRAEIVEAGRRMYERGFVASNDGNISARLDAKRLMTTPKSVSKGFMTPDMMVVVDYDGNKVSGDRDASSELPRHQADFREVLDRFHFVIRGVHVRPNRESAVVREQQTVVRLDVFPHGRRQLGRRWCAVLGNGDAAKGRHDFGKHRAIERNARDGKAGCDRRVRMDDRLNIGAVLVHLEVHEQL